MSAGATALVLGVLAGGALLIWGVPGGSHTSGGGTEYSQGFQYAETTGVRVPSNCSGLSEQATGGFPSQQARDSWTTGCEDSAAKRLAGDVGLNAK